MTEDVYITIRGEHTQDGQKQEPVLFKTRGRYNFKNGKHYLRYTEQEQDSSSLLKFDEQSLTVHRKGGASSDMYFEEGRHYEFPYHTGQGALFFAVETKALTLSGTKDDRRIEIEIRYDLYAGEQKLQESHVVITCVPYPIV